MVGHLTGSATSDAGKLETGGAAQSDRERARVDPAGGRRRHWAGHGFAVDSPPRAAVHYLCHGVPVGASPAPSL
jgi:hypothetical protein